MRNLVTGGLAKEICSVFQSPETLLSLSEVRTGPGWREIHLYDKAQDRTLDLRLHENEWSGGW